MTTMATNITPTHTAAHTHAVEYEGSPYHAPPEACHAPIKNPIKTSGHPAVPVMPAARCLFF